MTKWSGRKVLSKKTLVKINRPRKTKKVTSTKQVYKIAKRVLHNQIENKTAFNLQELDITPKMQVANCYKIVPSISQGTGQGQRVGNRVKIMKLSLGFTATLLPAPEGFPDTGRSGVYFDLYIFKALQKPSYDQIITAADLDYFLQAGSTFNGYSGDAFNWHQTVNKDRFECVFKHRKLLNNMAYKSQAQGLTYEVYGQNTNSSVTGRITLAKKLNKTLKYQDNVTNAVNDAYYAVIVCSRGDVQYPPDNEQPFGRVMYYTEMTYEDA